MLKGDRIAARIQALGISQAALGRALGISQQAVGKLVKGTSRNTAHLMRLARELRTSPEYLLGETEDPEEGALAPPPAPTVQHVSMQVAMPSEAALARMFEGLLRPLDRTAPVDELARILAQRLPNGLARLATALPPEATAPATAPDAVPPPLAKDHPASQPGSRT